MSADDFTFDVTRGFRMADRDGRSAEGGRSDAALAVVPVGARVRSISNSIDRPSLPTPDPWLMLAGEFHASADVEVGDRA